MYSSIALGVDPICWRAVKTDTSRLPGSTSMNGQRACVDSRYSWLLGVTNTDSLVYKTADCLHDWRPSCQTSSRQLRVWSNRPQGDGLIRAAALPAALLVGSLPGAAAERRRTRPMYWSTYVETTGASSLSFLHAHRVTWLAISLRSDHVDFLVEVRHEETVFTARRSYASAVLGVVILSVPVFYQYFFYKIRANLNAQVLKMLYFVFVYHTYSMELKFMETLIQVI